MYFVWRRNDGYVHATCGYMPQGWITTKGEHVTFEQLGIFVDWLDARKLIETERDKNEKPTYKLEW